MLKGLSHGAIALISAVGVFIVAICLIGSMWVFGYGLFSRTTADFRGRTQQIEQTRANGAYRIAQYDHFFDLCAEVQTDEASVKNLQQELKTHPSKQRQAIINASIIALQNQRADNINQYNADARKADTAGHFRSSTLPYQLNINSKETKCVVSSK